MKETIVQKAYDLLKVSIPVLNKFPRSHKFTLADRLQNHLSDLLELYIEAYFSSTATKRSLLSKANIKLEQLRHYFRLCFDLGLYPSTRYEEFALKIDEIGRMTGGWLKALQNSKN